MSIGQIPVNRFWSRLVHDLHPYVPGEQPRMPNVVKLNTNESPFGPSPRVLDAVRAEAAETLRLYPDPEATALRRALAAYHAVRPEFGCSLSIRATVVSRRPGWYVLDAGSKAISKDFGMPVIKGQSGHRVDRLSEEHTRVLTDDPAVKVGDRFEVIPAHCCATMNLHRTCVAVRRGRVEAVWPIEASGRYD